MMDEDFAKLTPAQLKKGIEGQHPAAYYMLATKLFAADEKDEAVFWFYAGQLRYRFHLAANPELEPSGDPALFAALSEQVGRPLNEYAFGDVPKLAATIDRVLEWDTEHGNGFTDKSAHASALEGIRTGLGEMREMILKHQEQIKQQRKEAGLE
jgi:hypothetical protein